MSVLITPGFDLVSAQDLVDKYMATGHFVYAARLLQAMKDQTEFDRENSDPDFHFLIDLASSEIDEQLAKVRKFIRSGV